ncbi:MAG: divergent PAP2 family protein [Candidatus Woesearchaeota archaeon]
MIYELVTNKIFLAALLGSLSAQVLKILLLIYKERQFSFKLILRRASMPSAHSATVAALTTALYLDQGFTPLTITMLFISAIIIRDLIDINLGIPEKEKIKRVKAPIHTPLEITFGILLGIAVTLAIFGFPL